MSKTENNIENDSAYAKSLKRLLKSSTSYRSELGDTINNEEQARDNFNKLPITTIKQEILIMIILHIIKIPILISIKAFLVQNLAILSTIIVAAPILSIPISSILQRKCTKKISIITQQFDAINTIYEYLRSELKISKEHDNLLSNDQILEKERIHNNDINYILQNSYVQDINNKYSEEYRKNKIIIDSLKNLDDNQKKEYLDRIYQQMRNDFTKTTIDINELALPNESSIRLELPSTNTDDDKLPLFPSGDVGIFENITYLDDKNDKKFQKRYPN